MNDLMRTKKMCVICGHKMAAKIEVCKFTYLYNDYHANALTYTCSVCGLQTLGTCLVQFYDAESEQLGDESIAEAEKRCPDMYQVIDGKRRISEKWIDWMITEKKWFRQLYEWFTPKNYKEKRYLSNHLPSLQMIHHNILYDTSTSRMYHKEEKQFGRISCCMYYYVTQTRRYFRIIVKYGSPDDFSVLELNDVKKLLAQKPDIYKTVIEEAVEE